MNFEPDWAAQAAATDFSALVWVVILVGVALLPFLLAAITSFAKLAIVGGILRQALGTPRVPPTSVVTGLALVLSLHVMSPVIVDAWRGFRAAEEQLPEPTDEVERARQSGERLRLGLASTAEPMRAFLTKHASEANVELFRSLRTRLAGDAQVATGEAGFDDGLELLTVLAPAFLLTELTEAFQIGFLLLLPFLVIDLVVSNLLLALGMHMLSPLVVSLPLKLLLFVLIDGWTLILQGVVSGYL